MPKCEVEEHTVGLFVELNNLMYANLSSCEQEILIQTVILFPDDQCLRSNHLFKLKLFIIIMRIDPTISMGRYLPKASMPVATSLNKVPLVGGRTGQLKGREVYSRKSHILHRLLLPKAGCRSLACSRHLPDQSDLRIAMPGWRLVDHPQIQRHG